MITLIIGPMYAGKSSDLFTVTRRHVRQDHKCLFVKYRKDNRYSEDKIYTHDNINLDEDCLISPKTINIEDILKYSPEVVCIDEGQFFDNLVDVSIELSKRDISVYISALNSDYRGKMFPSIVEIIPHCDTIKFLNAICSRCKEDRGIYSRRKSDEKEIELIGGLEMYYVLCRKCLLSELSPEVSYWEIRKKKMKRNMEEIRKIRKIRKRSL